MPSEITFLLLPHTNLLDLGAASQVFYEAKDQGLDLNIQFCSGESKIVSSPGLPLGKIESYKRQKLNKGDYLIVPSSDYKFILSKEFNPDKALLNWLVELKVRRSGLVLRRKMILVFG